MIEIELKTYIPEVIQKLDGTFKQRMEESCLVVKEQINETLSGSRSGRRYKVPGTKNTYYTASAPGQPPAVATGRLRQSIASTIETENNLPVGKVGSNVPYAPMLEYGTRKMAARPWLKSSFDKVKDKVIEIFTRVI